jgi:hypothetical protein
LDETIGNGAGRRELRLAVLNHALSLNGEEASNGTRAELLLRLAELRREAGRLDEAGVVYKRLGQMELAGAMAGRLARGRLAWLVDSKQYERALTQAEAMLADGSASEAVVCGAMLDAAAAAMADRKTEQAGALLARVERVGGEAEGGLPEQTRSRLTALRRKLAELQARPPAMEGEQSDPATAEAATEG